MDFASDLFDPVPKLNNMQNIDSTDGFTWSKPADDAVEVLHYVSIARVIAMWRFLQGLFRRKFGRVAEAPGRCASLNSDQ